MSTISNPINPDEPESGEIRSKEGGRTTCPGNIV